MLGYIWIGLFLLMLLSLIYRECQLNHSPRKPSRLKRLFMMGFVLICVFGMGSISTYVVITHWDELSILINACLGVLK